MNKTSYLLAFALFLLFAAAPASAQAAFTFDFYAQQTESTGYTNSGEALYTSNTYYYDPSVYNPYIGPATPLAEVCRQTAQASGLSDSVETYCAYSGSTNPVCIGHSYWGSGGGDGGSCSSGSVYNGYARIYQSPIQSRPRAAMKQALYDYQTQLMLYQSGYASEPTDPGYRDVCPNAPGEGSDPGKCEIYLHAGEPPTLPTASLTANPTSIVTGSASALTHSCTNATSASISSVGTVSATSGTTSVSPSSTTTYTLTCTNAAGSATADATVTVSPALTASCSVAPTSITTGSSATWTASASGGTGTYAYSWTGTDSLSGTGSSVAKTYSTAGTKTASVTVTSGSQTVTQGCSNNLTVTTAPASNLSCTVSNTNPQVGQTVTYTASGASAPYTWTPSDGVGNYGSGTTARRTFTAPGQYGMTVSKSGYTSGNCPVVTAGAAACVNPSASITATPDRVREGDPTTLTWSASGVDSSCTITGPGVNQTVSGSSCVIPGGQATPTITAQSVYTISCDSGEFSDQVVVNLIPKFIEF